jgi:hypothetical protein
MVRAALPDTYVQLHQRQYGRRLSPQHYQSGRRHYELRVSNLRAAGTTKSVAGNHFNFTYDSYNGLTQVTLGASNPATLRTYSISLDK